MKDRDRIKIKIQQILMKELEPEEMLLVNYVSVDESDEDKRKAEFDKAVVEEAAKLRVADLPVRKSLVEKFEILNDPMMAPFYKMLETSDNTPAFLLNKNWKEVQRNLAMALENILIGNTDAKTGLTDVVNKSEHLLN